MSTTDMRSTTFEYDGVKNNGIYVHFMDDSVPEYMLYAGLMGKPSEDMISAYSVKYSKDSQPNSVTCSTDKDSKGRVSAYYENGSLQYSFYYSDTVGQNAAARLRRQEDSRKTYVQDACGKMTSLPAAVSHRDA